MSPATFIRAVGRYASPGCPWENVQERLKPMLTLNLYIAKMAV